MTTDLQSPPRHGRRLWALGLLVALLLAAVVSSYAASSPDGLEKVADDEGFLAAAEEPATADGPLADYAVRGVDDDRLATGGAGALGVAITLAVGAGTLWLVRRRGDPPAS